MRLLIFVHRCDRFSGVYHFVHCRTFPLALVTIPEDPCMVYLPTFGWFLPSLVRWNTVGFSSIFPVRFHRRIWSASIFALSVPKRKTLLFKTVFKKLWLNPSTKIRLQKIQLPDFHLFWVSHIFWILRKIHHHFKPAVINFAPKTPL